MLGVLSNLRIITKTLAIVMFLSFIAAAIGVVGIRSLATMRDAADEMNRKSDLSVTAIRLNPALMAVGSWTFRAISEPSAAVRKEALAGMTEEADLFRKRAATLIAAADADTRAKVEAALRDFESLEKLAKGLIAEAESIGSASDQAREAFRQRAAEAAATLKRIRQMTREILAVFAAGVDSANNDATLTYETASSTVLSTATFGILFGLGLGIVVGVYGLSRPTRRMVGVLERLAAGDLTAEVEGRRRRDEIGEVARAAQVFKENLIKARNIEAEAAAAKAQAEQQRRKAMLDLADRFEHAVGGIVDTVSSAATEMQATAMQLTATARATSEKATSVTAAAEEAGSSVTAVAGAAEELGTSVSEIDRQVESSAERAKAAVGETRATVTVVGDLEAAAGRISAIVELISSIASKTNLLALNATIEAARAGDAGRGFAVVAAEVKDLADQTARATQEIGRQIAEIQSTTGKAVASISGISARISDIDQTTGSIAAAVRQQGTATDEIAGAAANASVGAREVTSNMAHVARSAEETGAAAAQVLDASGELARQAEGLRRQVHSFLASVRAA